MEKEYEITMASTTRGDRKQDCRVRTVRRLLTEAELVRYIEGLKQRHLWTYVSWALVE